MPEIEAVTKPKTAGFVDSKHVNANKRRIEQEEAEIEQLTQTEEQPKEEQSADAAVETVTEEPKENLSKEEQTYKKRYADLRKHLNETTSKMKELEERLNNPQDPSNVRPPKSDEDIGAWAAKYPDVAAIVETIAEKKAQEKFNTADERLKRIDEINEEATRVENESIIRKSHSDFDDLKASDAFHNWAEEQPKWVQDALYINADDPKSVVRVIDLYKVDNGMDLSGKKSSSKKAASAVLSKRTGSTPDSNKDNVKWTESLVDKMSMREYEANEADIHKDMQSPSFYDLSGGAR